MKFVIYILLFFAATQMQGQEKSLFDQATQHYADGQFKAAIKD